MNEPVEGSPKTGGITFGAPGTQFQPKYVNRKAVMYGVFESELTAISAFNALATTCFSLSAWCGSLSFTLYLQKLFSPEMNIEGQILVALGIPTGLVLATLFLVGAIYLNWQRGSDLARIKRESQIVDPD